MKPSLKQLQQSIQTITASHSEDGRKTMHFSFAKLASALLYVILCIVSHIMLGCVLFRATVPQSKSCRSVSVVAQGIYVCACLFGKTFRFVRFYSLTDAVPNIQHGSPSMVLLLTSGDSDALNASGLHGQGTKIHR